MKKLNTRQIVLAAVVAALYTVLSYFSEIFGLAYGPIQCRFSEALCVLPFFFPETCWGLFVGCILTNIMSSYGPVDIIFGSMATLLAALCTAKCKNRYLAPLPPVIANGLIVGATISWFEVGFTDAFLPAYLYNAATVAIGEAIACYVLGLLLLSVLPKIRYLRQYIAPEKLPNHA